MSNADVRRAGLWISIGIITATKDFLLQRTKSKLAVSWCFFFILHCVRNVLAEMCFLQSILIASRNHNCKQKPFFYNHKIKIGIGFFFTLNHITIHSIVWLKKTVTHFLLYTVAGVWPFFSIRFYLVVHIWKNLLWN